MTSLQAACNVRLNDAAKLVAEGAFTSDGEGPSLSGSEHSDGIGSVETDMDRETDEECTTSLSARSTASCHSARSTTSLSARSANHSRSPPTNRSRACSVATASPAPPPRRYVLSSYQKYLSSVNSGEHGPDEDEKEIEASKVSEKPRGRSAEDEKDVTGMSKEEMRARFSSAVRSSSPTSLPQASPRASVGVGSCSPPHRPKRRFLSQSSQEEIDVPRRRASDAMSSGRRSPLSPSSSQEDTPTTPRTPRTPRLHDELLGEDDSTAFAKKREKKEQVVNELMETEKKYLNNLCALLYIFLVPMSKWCDGGVPGGGDVPPVLANLIPQLVRSIRLLVGLHRILLGEIRSASRIELRDDSLEGRDRSASLERVKENSENGIGAVFISFASYLSSYYDYVNHYSRANEGLRDMATSSPSVAAAIEVSIGKQPIGWFLALKLVSIQESSMC